MKKIKSHHQSQKRSDIVPVNLPQNDVSVFIESTQAIIYAATSGLQKQIKENEEQFHRILNAREQEIFELNEDNRIFKQLNKESKRVIKVLRKENKDQHKQIHVLVEELQTFQKQKEKSLQRQKWRKTAEKFNNSSDESGYEADDESSEAEEKISMPGKKNQYKKTFFQRETDDSDDEGLHAFMKRAGLNDEKEISIENSVKPGLT